MSGSVAATVYEDTRFSPASYGCLLSMTGNLPVSLIEEGVRTDESRNKFVNHV
jgi:hypothetical protein